MDVVERYTAAFTENPVDRVPVCAVLGLPFLQRLTGQSPRRILEEQVSDPTSNHRDPAEPGPGPHRGHDRVLISIAG